MTPTEKSPLIIGHRGASALAPENTLAAFARAFREGADGIEFDVRLARDGVPVVIHDSNLRHTGRRKGKIANLTSRRLAEIDVGSWFNHAHRPLARLQFTRQTVPTLHEVFGMLANEANPDLVAYVELKTVRNRKSNAALVDAVVETVNRHQFQKRVVLISFNLAALRRVKGLDASIRTGALFGSRQRAIKSARRIVAAAIDCGADEILLHHLIATRKILRLSREAGLAALVWTVDNPKWLARARDNGIKGLITNNPANLIAG